MKKVKIAQIGVTHEHAPGKIATLKNLPDLFEIVGVCDDRSFSKTPCFFNGNMKPYDGLRFMTLEEILADDSIEAVTVEVPNNELVPIAMRCAQRGLAMHMDKPAGEDLGPYKELLELCKAKSLPFQMGFMFRSNAAFQVAIRAIREKWIGEVIEIDADMHHNYGGEPYQEYISRFPGGIMYNLGCHLIDFVAAAMGEPRRVTSFMHPAPGYGEGVRNHGLAVLEYEHAFVTLRSCSKTPYDTNSRAMRIIGTKGTVHLCPLENFASVSPYMDIEIMLNEACDALPEGKHTLRVPSLRDRYAGQLQELYAMIREGKKSFYTFEHDLLVHKITLAASGYTKWS
ncbi:MAG: Gfo/Idh/MocA family oxidoreductase [Lentisphaeria bacterium]|nr:Gfo/Idh/MocA family oxidoreductase [Lentisphaeria bacterium]